MTRRKILLVLLILAGLLAASWLAVPKILDDVHGNVPIVFYGRVVNQEDKGVPNAEVSGFILAEQRFGVPIGFADTQIKKPISLRTDADGNFVIRGETGGSMDVKVASPYGYVGRDGKLFNFRKYSAATEVYTPDPGHPVIFHIQGPLPGS